METNQAPACIYKYVKMLWVSSDRFLVSTDSPPVSGGASGLAIGWPRQTQLALVINNNKRNVQIPAGTINMTLTWGGPQPASMPWEPTSLTTLTISERWGRDLPFKAGQVVTARLLYRRSMLEMYIDDYLFPVYAMPDATGQFSVTNGTIVTGAKAWKMSLPADGNPGAAA